jgi:threonyl-tRNA synthetase
VFCTDEQAEAEVERFCRALPRFYAAFGFEQMSLALSTRPADRAGADVLWDRAESALEAVLDRLDIPYALQPGAGAFYGPKLELLLSDRAGRPWQCGTIQFDLVMPERFDVRYVAASGEKKRVVMLHRALYGSLERFLGMLLEHYGAALPPWLAPEQIAVIPVAEPHAAWAREVGEALRGAGLRVRVDAREESLSRRIAEAHQAALPFVAVVGAREAAARSVAMRCGQEQHVLPLQEGLALLKQRCAPPSFC